MLTGKRNRFLAFSLLSLLTVPAWSAPMYRVVPLGTLESWASGASGLNDSNEVVGWSNIYNSNSGFLNERAFLYSNGTMTDLGTFYGQGFPDDPKVYRYSSATAISNSGLISGEGNHDNIKSGFFYSQGALQSTGTLGGTVSTAVDINDAGQLVGTAQLSNSYSHAFVYQYGTLTDLGTLGGNNSSAYAINASGKIVGVSDTSINPANKYLLHHL